MVYPSGFRFPDREQEANYMAFSPRARQTCYDSYYPFGLFEGRTLPANVRTRSNGESTLAVFSERIREDALYLLDEPENSLSIAFQMELSKYISDSARHFGCQFIMATHSPVLLSIKDALIYDLDETPVETKKWTELDNVRRYFNFFEEHRSEFL